MLAELGYSFLEQVISFWRSASVPRVLPFEDLHRDVAELAVLVDEEPAVVHAPVPLRLWLSLLLWFVLVVVVVVVVVVPLRSGRVAHGGKAELRLAGFLSFDMLYRNCCQNLTGMSPEFHRNFSRSSPEFQQNFTGISNWSAVKKGDNHKTQPSHIAH